MRHSTHPACRARHQRGFGLIEVLVGCVLMAVLSLGACAALHQALRAVHSAALHGRAAALAMDLAEELVLAADAAAAGEIAATWLQRVPDVLPGSQGEVVPAGSASEIRLYWWSAPDLPEQLSLPLAARFSGDAP